MVEFDADSRVIPQGNGSWRAAVSDRWSIGTAPNGGYLASILARCAIGEVGGALQSAQVSFLAPVEPGSVDVLTMVLKRGRSFSVVRTTLVQMAARVEALFTLRHGTLVGPSFTARRAPDLPPPTSCVPGRPGPTSRLSIADRVEMALSHAPSWRHPPHSERPTLEGWVRFADGRPLDELSLVFFADAFPAPVLNLSRVDAAWVPSLSMQVHVWKPPAPGWLRGRFETHTMLDGTLDESGELYDDAGALVATVQQLARIIPNSSHA